MTDRSRPEHLAELLTVAEARSRPEPVEWRPVRVRLRPDIIDPAGWHEIRELVVLWIAAGSARIETGEAGDTIPHTQVAEVDDVKDLYGYRLVFLDPPLARLASLVLTETSRRPDLDHTLNPDLRDAI